MYRAVGQVFDFGKQQPATNRRSEAITRGDLCLKFISADWRIIQEGRILLGSSDFGAEGTFYDLEEAPELAYNAEAWRLARDFFIKVREGVFVVESFSIGSFAEVNVQMTHRLSVESFASAGQDLDILWFHNRRTDVSCLVGPSGANLGQAGKRGRLPS